MPSIHPASSSRTTSNPFGGSGGQQGFATRLDRYIILAAAVAIGAPVRPSPLGAMELGGALLLGIAHLVSPSFSRCFAELEGRGAPLAQPVRDSRRSCGARFPAARHAGGGSQRQAIYGEGREPLARRALAILEKAFGSEDPKVARSLNNLASLAFATHRSLLRMPR